MAVRAYKGSFNAGEISPELIGRVQEPEYQNGLQTCRNFLVRPAGPVESRPGFEFVHEVKHSDRKTRLIPFVFSTTETRVIEVGHQYFRFHTMGGTIVDTQPPMQTPPPYEIASPYDEADIFDIHYIQSADVMTLVHPKYPPKELRRLGAENWKLVDIDFTSPLAAPTGVSAANTGSGTDYTYHYKVTALGDDTGTLESLPSADASVANNLYDGGALNTITWTAVTGAARYNVYKLHAGLYGYIGQTESTQLIDDNIAADMSMTPPNYDDVFDAQYKYPGAVSYFEQRRWFAGTLNKPQHVWATRSGTESNMGYSIPLNADDRVSFRIAAREMNTIRHIVPLQELMLLTSSAEWRLTSVGTGMITPSSISVQPQSYVGASNVQPAMVNTTLVYGAARGGHMRELAYSYEANGYMSGDLCLRASHLFDGLEVVDMVYAKAPIPMVWCVSSSGKLLGMTYIPGERVMAWHQHDTAYGAFESCTAVAEGNEDHLYVVVKRNIDGVTKRYVERLHESYFPELEDAFRVDSGLTFYNARVVTGITQANPAVVTTYNNHDFGDGDAVRLSDVAGMTEVNGITYTAANVTANTFELHDQYGNNVDSTAFSAYASGGEAREMVDEISGLIHLEDMEVAVLGDGAVFPNQVVSHGKITLPHPAGKVHIGLPITSDVQTLPVVLPLSDGSIGRGHMKNISRLWLRVAQSSGIFIGPDATRLTEYKQRTTEPPGSPPALKTGPIDLLLRPQWNDGGALLIRQTAPLPLTLLSMTAEIELGN